MEHTDIQWKTKEICGSIYTVQLEKVLLECKLFIKTMDSRSCDNRYGEIFSTRINY